MYNVAQVIDEKCMAKKGCRLCIMYCPEANCLDLQLVQDGGGSNDRSMQRVRTLRQSSVTPPSMKPSRCRQSAPQGN